MNSLTTEVGTVLKTSPFNQGTDENETIEELNKENNLSYVNKKRSKLSDKNSTEVVSIEDYDQLKQLLRERTTQLKVLMETLDTIQLAQNATNTADVRNISSTLANHSDSNNRNDGKESFCFSYEFDHYLMLP